MIGDFESTLGLPDYWANAKDQESDRYWAQIFLIIFIFLVVQLFLAVILTICTNPGNVP